MLNPYLYVGSPHYHKVGVELEWMAANPDAPGYPFLAAKLGIDYTQC